MIPRDYQQSEAKRRLVGRVHAINAMLKAATDELCNEAHAEPLFIEDGTDDLGDPINRVFDGLMRHTERARAAMAQCLVVLEHWRAAGR